MVGSVGAEQYRQAAEEALEQLGWCIEYLRSIRRNQIARALARNRDHIRRGLTEARCSASARR